MLNRLWDLFDRRKNAPLPPPVEPDRIFNVNFGSLPIASGAIKFQGATIDFEYDLTGIESPVLISGEVLGTSEDEGEVVKLKIEMFDRVEDEIDETISENFGHYGIKLVVGDCDALTDHWTETGLNRTGVISTAPDEKLLRLLKKKFSLRTQYINPVQHNVIGSVSEELELEILSYLKTIPEYEEFPFAHFHVQTNDSFDRVNYFSDSWSWMPIGNSPEPKMLVCHTVDGMGEKILYKHYAAGKLHSIEIDLMVPVED